MDPRVARARDALPQVPILAGAQGGIEAAGAAQPLALHQHRVNRDCAAAGEGLERRARHLGVAAHRAERAVGHCAPVVAVRRGGAGRRVQRRVQLLEEGAARASRRCRGTRRAARALARCPRCVLPPRPALRCRAARRNACRAARMRPRYGACRRSSRRRRSAPPRRDRLVQAGCRACAQACPPHCAPGITNDARAGRAHDVALRRRR